jgi:hypothetical protein
LPAELGDLKAPIALLQPAAIHQFAQRLVVLVGRVTSDLQILGQSSGHAGFASPNAGQGVSVTAADIVRLPGSHVNVVPKGIQVVNHLVYRRQRAIPILRMAGMHVLQSPFGLGFVSRQRGIDDACHQTGQFGRLP